MRLTFYDSPGYRSKQAAITKANAARGVYDHLKKQERRRCARTECGKVFTATPSNPKKFCGSSCAAKVNNIGRSWPVRVKRKIARSMMGKAGPMKGIQKVPRLTGVCANPKCNKVFTYERHKKRKFCSVHCNMVVTGSRPTSPKASRGKAGIRNDISPTIYFYSRWEANIARLFTYQGMRWEYSPVSFDIGGQMYTPDFYLPDSDTFIEVKNFWGEYSRNRDTKFRKTHPTVILKVLLKEEYLQLEEKYARLIPQWEYKYSPSANAKALSSRARRGETASQGLQAS